MSPGTATLPRSALVRAHRMGARLLDLALPARCPGCGAEGPPICERCLPDLFGRLGRPGGTLLGLSADVPAPLVQLEWCAPFEGLVRTSLHHLKYGGERRLAAVLGEAVAQRWRSAGAGGSVLVPVTVHRDRERQRGYDQAVLLARVAAMTLALPVVGALERTRATTAQFELDRRHRAANVARAFRVRPGAAASVAGQWAVLVDDVATTGSTLASCGRALLDAGAVAVSAVTVAREQ
jgi:ComF family protein